MREDYCKDRRAAGRYYNIVLYRMCLEDQPHHGDKDAVAGKLLLIGRSYAASPERGAGEALPGDNPDFFQWLAESAEWLALDQELAKLPSDAVFGLETLSRVLEIHQFLCDMIKEATRLRMRGKAPRQHTSFCSKYLHFHKPDHFPIYDSYVSTAVTREVGINKRISTGRGHDPRYSRFCQQLLAYRTDKPSLTLRDLDGDLYQKHRDYREEAALFAQ